MSFSQFKAIGVSLSDLSILDGLLASQNLKWSISDIVKCRSSFGQGVYHEMELSLPFRMLLRLLVGITVFHGLDDGHRDAIFFNFEDSYRALQSNLHDLETFWALCRKFFSNHRLSKPVLDEVNKGMSEANPWYLVKNILEFNIPFHLTRSKSRVLPLVLEAQKGRHIKRCLPRVIRRERAERELSRRRLNLKLSKINAEEQRQAHNEGMEEGRHAGRVDGDEVGNHDGYTRNKAIFQFQFDDDDQRREYMSGYRTGYVIEFVRNYISAFNRHRPKPVARRLIFD